MNHALKGCRSEPKGQVRVHRNIKKPESILQLKLQFHWAPSLLQPRAAAILGATVGTSFAFQLPQASSGYYWFLKSPCACTHAAALSFLRQEAAAVKCKVPQDHRDKWKKCQLGNKTGLQVTVGLSVLRTWMHLQAFTTQMWLVSSAWRFSIFGQCWFGQDCKCSTTLSKTSSAAEPHHRPKSLL